MIFDYIPEVDKPKIKLGLSEKLKWTLLFLVAFFVLGALPLYPVTDDQLSIFNDISVLLGAEFGSLITLGIGPIVTASIILQLLKGAGILKIDLSNKEGKEKFESYQKVFSYALVLFESIAYVISGTIKTDFPLLVISQLAIGGFLMILLDDAVSRWGIGSGISLFIAAGVSKELFTKLFGFLGSGGALINLVSSLIKGDVVMIIVILVSIFTTILIMILAVYFQGIKIEVPISLGQTRNCVNWPINFLYTSNMPVILLTSFFATIQVWVKITQSVIGSPIPFLGGYYEGQAFGLMKILEGVSIFRGELFSSFIYVVIMALGGVIFSVLWSKVSSLDAESQADSLIKQGFSISGIRSTKSIMKLKLEKYIPSLVIMSGFTIGLLSGFADILGSFVRGTGLVLTVMIIYQFYSDSVKDHLTELDPNLKRIMGG